MTEVTLDANDNVENCSIPSILHMLMYGRITNI